MTSNHPISQAAAMRSTPQSRLIDYPGATPVSASFFAYADIVSRLVIMAPGYAPAAEEVQAISGVPTEADLRVLLSAIRDRHGPLDMLTRCIVYAIITGTQVTPSYIERIAGRMEWAIEERINITEEEALKAHARGDHRTAEDWTNEGTRCRHRLVHASQLTARIELIVSRLRWLKRCESGWAGA